MKTRQILHNYRAITISELVARKEALIHYPKCQRGFCWSLSMQKRLIDSILRGYPIGWIVLVPANDDLSSIHWVVDGQQRLETIFRYVGNEFATAKEIRWDPDLKPIVRNRHYSELDSDMKNMFDGYPVQLCVCEWAGESMADHLASIFRRGQEHRPLNTPEKLHSYVTEQADLMAGLSSHPIWEDFYSGRIDRLQPIQIALMCAMLEASDGMCNLTTPRLRETIYGAGIGKKINRKLAKRIESQFDILMKMYGHARPNSMSSFMLLYQSAILLQQDGYDLALAAPGCLEWWFDELLEEMDRQRKKGFWPSLQFRKVTDQRKFWHRHLEALESSTGLRRLDGRRSFNWIQRLQLYKEQRGRCAGCYKPLKGVQSAHHIVAYSAGGGTALDNGALLCDSCHGSTK